MSLTIARRISYHVLEDTVSIDVSELSIRCVLVEIVDQRHELAVKDPVC